MNVNIGILLGLDIRGYGGNKLHNCFEAWYIFDCGLCRHMHLLLVTLYSWKIEVLKTIFTCGRERGCGGGCVVPVK